MKILESGNKHLKRARIWSMAIALSACATAARAPSAGQNSAGQRVADAPAAIAEALRSHPLVLISEHHWSVPVHDQLHRIIADPRVGALVQDIVVEFGNPLYQNIIDRYVAGETVPIDSLRLSWRNTTQLLAWDSPLYERFYQSIRALNATRPAARRLRLIAGDPPIDWTRTHRAEDIPRTYGFRDIETIGIIEHEVLAKGRRALVIIGEEHVFRATAPAPSASPKPLERMSLGEALHHRHPGKAFLVGTVVGTATPLARALTRWPNGSIVQIAGTPLGLAKASMRQRDTASTSAVVPAAPGELRLQDLFDAVLYVGRTEQELGPTGAVYRREPEYEREIRRRIKILSAFYRVDIWSEDLDRLLRSEP